MLFFGSRHSASESKEEKQPLLSESEEKSVNYLSAKNEDRDSIASDSVKGVEVRSQFAGYCCYFICCGARNETVDFDQLSSSSSPAPSPSLSP